MGKEAKKILIFGVTLIAISGILFVFNTSHLAIASCFVPGLICSAVGAPYVNGVEQNVIRKKREEERNNRLIAKRNYVKNNINIFGLRDDDANSLDERDVYLIPQEKMSDSYRNNGKDDLVNNKSKVKVRKRTRNDFN